MPSAIHSYTIESCNCLRFVCIVQFMHRLGYLTFQQLTFSMMVAICYIALNLTLS